MRGKKNIAGYSSRSRRVTDARIASRSNGANYTRSSIEPSIAKIWPIIEVPKCEAIPIDYPGPMGVPMTFLDKISGRNDGRSGFLVIDSIKPRSRGKDLYQRLVIVNTRFCRGRYQIYKKPNGTYCTAETFSGKARR